MPSLPTSASFTGSTVTEGQFKTNLADMREFLAGLLGTSGNAVDARPLLQVPANKSAGGSVDLNTLVESGMFKLEASLTNKPSGASDYGQLLVIRGTGNTVAQMYFPYDASGTVYARAGNPSQVGGAGSWGAWQALATQAWVNTAIATATLTPTAGSTYLIARIREKEFLGYGYGAVLTDPFDLRVLDISQSNAPYSVAADGELDGDPYGSGAVGVTRGVNWFMRRGGSIRVAYDHRRYSDGNHETRIYKNGTQVSAVAIPSSTWVNQAVDLTVDAGDYLSLFPVSLSMNRTNAIRQVRIWSGTPAYEAVHW